MKYHIFLVVIGFLLYQHTSAQLSQEQRIQDSIIGWYSVLPKKATAAITKNGYTFSVKQQEHLNEIIRWMHKTYTPVGGLGTFEKDFDADQGIKRYPPHVYGIEFGIWNVTYDKRWMTTDGKFKPVSEEYTAFFMAANFIPESRPVVFLNNSNRYVFTMPPDGSGGEQLKARRQSSDIRIHPNVHSFMTRQSEYQVIYLAPGNTLPVKTVTKGELLDMAESSIENVLKTEWEKVQGQFPDAKTAQEAFNTRKKAIEQHRTYIQQLRKKHQQSLDQPAIVDAADITIYGFEVDRDPFEISDIEKQRKQYYTVHQYTKELLDKCRTDQPQWIAIAVPFETREDGNQLYEMYTSVIENFNYAYAYNYFFNPEKVKGISYTPANEESLTARLNAYRKKGVETSTASNNASAPNMLYQDDFSANSLGSAPKGWYVNSIGEASNVTAIKDEPGKWLKLGYNNPVSPTVLKKPLPKNFSMSFDIATDGFSSRSGGAVTLYMSTYPLLSSGTENKAKDGAWIKLTITSGNANDITNNNFSGGAKLELHTNPPIYRENFNEGAFFTMGLADFSNKKRKTKVQLTMVNGEIRLKLNDHPVVSSLKDMKRAYGGACEDCRIPDGLLFNTIRWENMTNNAKETGVYIGNIKIMKL